MKIPATEAGVVAFEEAVGLGVPVNVTLPFGLPRHSAVAEAYVRGLDRFASRGGDPATLPSVASFFVSRVGSETDARLTERPELIGRLAIANAKLAYRGAREVFSRQARRMLEAHGVTLEADGLRRFAVSWERQFGADNRAAAGRPVDAQPDPSAALR